MPSILKFAVSHLPETIALQLIKNRAEKTTPARVSDQEQAALDEAAPLRYGPGGTEYAWSWGSGPLVVLIHGWGGRASQMAPLAREIARLGFRSVAIDLTGHGQSPAHRTRWSTLIGDVSAIARTLGDPIHALVGHSAGGLSMMAARALHGVRAERYVCICAPSHPFPPIRGVEQLLAPPPNVIDRYKGYIAGQFETDWATLASGHAYRGAGHNLLLCYDEKDRFVAHTEGDRIQTLCPSAQLVKTSNFGHLKILFSPDLAQSVSGFLTSAAARAGSVAVAGAMS